MEYTLKVIKDENLQKSLAGVYDASQALAVATEKNKDDDIKMFAVLQEANNAIEIVKFNGDATFINMVCTWGLSMGIDTCVIRVPNNNIENMHTQYGFLLMDTPLDQSHRWMYKQIYEELDAADAVDAILVEPLFMTKKRINRTVNDLTEFYEVYIDGIRCYAWPITSEDAQQNTLIDSMLDTKWVKFNGPVLLTGPAIGQGVHPSLLSKYML